MKRGVALWESEEGADYREMTLIVVIPAAFFDEIITRRMLLLFYLVHAAFVMIKNAVLNPFAKQKIQQNFFLLLFLYLYTKVS